MAVTYYALLTTIGAGKLANATALGTTLKITQLAVGDGGGNVPTPDASRTQLVNEVRRAPLNRLSVDPANSSQIIAEQVIPEDVGGWWIREMGLYDEAGALIAYANCAPSYKPQLAEGSGRTQTVRIVLIVSSAASVELKIDPSVVLATREYVDSAIVSAMNRLDCKQSVRVASTASITLSGLQTLDGITLVAGDRVLVKNQSNTVDNGIYVAATTAWKRSTDADENSEVTPGLTVVVESGTSQADSIWQLVTDGAIVLGTTALTFQNITNGLAKLLSPAFSGAPTAPTPAITSSDSSLATTAFVGNLVRSLGLGGNSKQNGVANMNGATVGAIENYNGSESDAVTNNWPVLGVAAGTSVHYNVFTFGLGSRIAQVAVQVFQGGNESRTFIRTKHDAVWSTWSEQATLNSPKLTGTPSSSTAGRGDNSTRIATTAYVRDALADAGLANNDAGTTPTDAAAVVTLKSGMYYLPNNISPYVGNAFLMRMSYAGNRGFEVANIPYTDRFFGRASNGDGTWRAPVELAPLASPVLSGNPTAPTAVQFDNDTSISTTAFVQRALGNFANSRSIQTATQLTAADCGYAIGLGGQSTYTVTLPDPSEVSAGASIAMHCRTAAPITVASKSGNQITPEGNIVSSIKLLNGENAVFVREGGVWSVYGTGALKHSAGFQAALTSNGYQKLPSGLIQQWGTATTGSNGIGSLVFPMPFPTACCSIQLTGWSAGASAAGGASLGAFSNTGATVYGMMISPSTGTSPIALTMHWFAVGY